MTPSRCPTWVICVGHEGEGSLLSRLKAEGLAEGLCAGRGLGWRGGALFSVSISLTEKGCSDYQRVLQLLFAYTDMLRKEGPQDWLYEEQSHVSRAWLSFQAAGQPISYVRAWPAACMITRRRMRCAGPIMMDRLRSGMINALLQQISRDNALVILSDESAATDEVSSLLPGALFPRQLERRSLQCLAGMRAMSRVNCLPPNDFIAEDVSLVELAADQPGSAAVACSRRGRKSGLCRTTSFACPGARPISTFAPRK